MTTRVSINGTEYTVTRVFRLVANYHFTTDDGAAYLVDGEDVAEWADTEGLEWTNGIDMAIAYARHYAEEIEDGNFWWTWVPA